MSDEVFGQITTGDDVRNAVITTVKLWMPTYLGMIARKTGRVGGDLKTFKSYATVFDLAKYAEDAIPACVVVAPGLFDQPHRDRTGYHGRWGVGIGSVVSGKDRDNTYSLATLYCAAVRALCLQKPSLGGFAEGVVWVSERYDSLASDDLRTIAAGIVQLGVDVQSITDPSQGPGTPVTQPVDVPDNWPTADQVFIDVEQGV